MHIIYCYKNQYHIKKNLKYEYIHVTFIRNYAHDLINYSSKFMKFDF